MLAHIGHARSQGGIDDGLAVHHRLLLDDAECLRALHGRQDKEIAVRKGCLEIRIREPPQKMHGQPPGTGFQLCFELSRAADEQLTAMHLPECLNQVLRALVIHQPPDEQHLDAFRIPALQDCPPRCRFVAGCVQRIGNDPAFVPEFGQKCRAVDVSPCRGDDRISTFEKAPENGLVALQEQLLLDDIAVPCDHHAAAAFRYQTCRIAQRERGVDFRHIRPVRHFLELPEKLQRHRAGEVRPQTAAKIHIRAVDALVFCPAAVILTDEDSYLRIRLLCEIFRPLLYERFDAADVGRVEFVHFQNVCHSIS